MPPSVSTLAEATFQLPPLILHPFNERVPPSTLLDNSKAALMLSGLIPSDGSEQDELKRRLMTGRYSEIRMLFFLGKDVFRWIDQCLEWSNRVPELKPFEMRRQSFAGLLTSNPPPHIREKLTRWGVSDYISIFSRAIGLNAVFAGPPLFDGISDEFLRNYHRYADYLFQCYMESETHTTITARNFNFDLYASGEYSRMLETEWEGSA